MLTERGEAVADVVADAVARADATLLDLVEDPAKVATTRRVLANMTAIPGDLGVEPAT